MDELLTGVFNWMDADQSGKLSLAELEHTIQKVAEIRGEVLIADWKDKVGGAFKMIDANGTG